MNTRNHTPLDRLLLGIDQALRTVYGRPQVTERPNPAAGIVAANLNDRQRDHVARLMRINHTGEVCAQALYAGQALTARIPEVRKQMERSAQEENDHLEWCERRLEELGNRKSLLNPLWYAGSFAMGAAAGLAGDKWSLGFVVETERQVESHLDDHLAQVPENDARTRAILQQMKVDEIHHADVAKAGGGTELPTLIKQSMKWVSKIMTRTVYWL